MRVAEQETAWLDQRTLSTDPEQLQAVDQLQFLDGLKRWSERYLLQPLPNGKAAGLAMVNRNVLEAWRTAPGTPSHRTMPLTRRMLLVFRLLEQLPTISLSAEDEEQLLRENWGRKTHAQIAAILQRTPQTIAKRARLMGLPTQPRAPAFSSEDLQFIRANYARLGTTEVGRLLGRSPEAVRTKAFKMGVAGKRGRPKHQSPGGSD